jgi:glycolate oxidase FAD binding subunit
VASVVATGTTGALRHRLGPVRDQVLGCTVVTGDGRIIGAGGRVAKNVAGYDLVKLQVGGFGAFGVITVLHLRLRALPGADLTLLTRGERDPLTLRARTLEAHGLDAACCELLSPAAAADATWVLAIRLVGPDRAVADEAARVRALASPADWTALDGDRAAAFWRDTARAMGGGTVSIRLGVLAEGVDETLDLLRQRLDLGLVSAGAARGGVRWSGDTDAAKLRELRHHFAAREIPLTLERAPWPVRSVTGHFGAYREGVGALVGELRQRFDPTSLLQVCLDGSASA